MCVCIYINPPTPPDFLFKISISITELILRRGGVTH